MVRILLIEDDPIRIALFQEWLPADARLVVASSAGKAVGILRRDRGRVYAGLLLDHDLQEQTITQMDRHLSGSDLIQVIVHNVSKEVPILVHSMNISRAPLMVKTLEAEGFMVTRIPMSCLSKADFMEWIEDAQDLWLYNTDDHIDEAR
jgi:CheY-like chemotaxis protein